VCALVGILLYTAAGLTSAATFVVTTTADTNDGACTVVLCSLRDAVIASNATAGPNIITLPAGTYTLTIAGTGENAAATGDLDITKPVTINGAGSATTIIDGGGLDRVFDVTTFGVFFNDLTIQNGLPGSGENGGGIQSNGTLTLNNCIVSGNHTAGGGSGAGIWTNNTLTLNSTTVTGNVASGGGNGGGIDNEDQVTINASVISGNSAGPAGGKGGGIYDNGGSSSITDSTISSNTTSNPGDGAGLYHNGSALPISRSTFSGNTSGHNGGGIYNNGINVTLTNVTISGNTAASGGGLFNFGNGVHIVA
jgi:CSLREA domain-containing protein